MLSMSITKMKMNTRTVEIGSAWHIFDYIDGQQKIGIVVTKREGMAYMWYTLLMSDGTIQESNSTSFMRFEPI